MGQLTLFLTKPGGGKTKMARIFLYTCVVVWSSQMSNEFFISAMITYYVTCFSTVDRRQAPQTILICCVVEFTLLTKLFILIIF